MTAYDFATSGPTFIYTVDVYERGEYIGSWYPFSGEGTPKCFKELLLEDVSFDCHRGHMRFDCIRMTDYEVHL